MDISRWLRILIGAGLIIGGLAAGESWWFVGIIPLVSGAFNTCGASSCGINQGRYRRAGEREQE
ncbi:MAG: DUF2892 domain-containing protein [Syntrophothermus sp.]